MHLRAEVTLIHCSFSLSQSFLPHGAEALDSHFFVQLQGGSRNATLRWLFLKITLTHKD